MEKGTGDVRVECQYRVDTPKMNYNIKIDKYKNDRNHSEKAGEP